MLRCDFASFMQILMNGMKGSVRLDQTDLVYGLFGSYVLSMKAEETLNQSAVSRWINGTRSLPGKLLEYYEDLAAQSELGDDIEETILPKLYDPARTMDELMNLVAQDPSISEEKKEPVLQHYPCKGKKKQTLFILQVFLLAAYRPSEPKRRNTLPDVLNTGMVLSDHICFDPVPDPCECFCGREEELKQLHELIQKEKKVFLYGIAGIGKSEIARAYVQRYENEYRNILYLPYEGDLYRQILELDCFADRPGEPDKERFHRHNKLLRRLSDDSLIILDNYNAEGMEDKLLPVLLKYRCRILITTRNWKNDSNWMEISEIEDEEVLYSLVKCFYEEADENHETVRQLIREVHRHTFAVELVARLLENGIMEPEELLQKIRSQHIALDSADRIEASKDGKWTSDTYFMHMRMLFRLFDLDEAYLSVMRSMTVIPEEGISMRFFAHLMQLQNMNVINELISRGMIQHMTRGRIGMKLILKEIVVAESQPAPENMEPLLTQMAQYRKPKNKGDGYYPVFIEIYKNALEIIKGEDPAAYWNFVKDAFLYMNDHQYYAGMKRILDSLSGIEDSQELGILDRAQILSIHAISEGQISKDWASSLDYSLRAAKLLDRPDHETYETAANAWCNAGDAARHLGRYGDAVAYMNKGLAIFHDHWKKTGELPSDFISQSINCAAVLGQIQRTREALFILDGCTRDITAVLGVWSLEYAQVLETRGDVILHRTGKKPDNDTLREALSTHRQAIAIYKKVLATKEEFDLCYSRILGYYEMVGYRLQVMDEQDLTTGMISG